MHTLAFGGLDRSYRVHKPPGLAGPAPLVVMLHGAFGACNTGIFAAIGPDSATMLDACTAPHPTSVIHIHGTADRLVPYTGGQGASTVNGPSIPDVNAFWRKVDQCGPPDVTTNAPITTSTAACADNRSVELITIAGGRHQWPGGTTFLERTSQTSHALNATQTIWQFFATHPA